MLYVISNARRIAAAGADVVGVVGQSGLTSLLQFKKDFEMQKNLSGLPLLGRTVMEEQQLLAEVSNPRSVHGTAGGKKQT